MKAPDGPSTLQSALCAESLKLSMFGGGRIQEVRRSQGWRSVCWISGCRKSAGVKGVRPLWFHGVVDVCRSIQGARMFAGVKVGV